MSPVIDRAARDKLAEGLHNLVTGQITNDDFEDARPEETGDPAVAAIWEFGSGLYSDTHAYRLTGWNSPSAEALGWANRAILFLRTDLPYEWPPSFRGQFVGGPALLACFAVLGVPLGVLAVGLLGVGEWVAAAATAIIPLFTGSFLTLWLLTRDARAEEERCFWATGERDVWPFVRRADFDDARRKQPL